jgi:hypothetical protein
MITFYHIFFPENFRHYDRRRLKNCINIGEVDFLDFPYLTFESVFLESPESIEKLGLDLVKINPNPATLLRDRSLGYNNV